MKLWLFLPGRHDSLNPLVHSAVTGLKGQQGWDSGKRIFWMWIDASYLSATVHLCKMSHHLWWPWFAFAMVYLYVRSWFEFFLCITVFIMVVLSWNACSSWACKILDAVPFNPLLTWKLGDLSFCLKLMCITSTLILSYAWPYFSQLVVVGAGVWRAPGECSEVASALVQALRNRIERWLEFFWIKCFRLFVYKYL